MITTAIIIIIVITMKVAEPREQERLRADALRSAALQKRSASEMRQRRRKPVGTRIRLCFKALWAKRLKTGRANTAFEPKRLQSAAHPSRNAFKAQRCRSAAPTTKMGFDADRLKRSAFALRNVAGHARESACEPTLFRCAAFSERRDLEAPRCRSDAPEFQRASWNVARSPWENEPAMRRYAAS